MLSSGAMYGGQRIRLGCLMVDLSPAPSWGKRDDAWTFVRCKPFVRTRKTVMITTQYGNMGANLIRSMNGLNMNYHSTYIIIS